MAKAKQATSEITRVTPDLSLPEHLRGKEVKGMDLMKQIVVPPRIKIVQRQSSELLTAKFPAGTVLSMPAEAVIAEIDTEFLFVPLFFYREWATWSPLEMRGQVPSILDRSADPTSAVAIKAQNPRTREESDFLYQGQKIKVRHVEHLNFVVSLYQHTLGTDPMTMSFSRGEHFNGCKFASLVKMRNASPFACVFEAIVNKEPRKNNKGSWFGLDISNPSEAPAWVTKEELEQLEKNHADVEKTFKAGLLLAQIEEPDGGEAEDSAATKGLGDDI